MLAIGVFIFAWTLASLAAVAFQCGLPKPWEVFTLHCYNIVRENFCVIRNFPWLLMCYIGTLLDCLLHYRYDDGCYYRNAVCQSGRISQDSAFEENCGSRLLSAAHSRHWRRTGSLGVPVPYLAAQQPSLPLMDTTNHHPNPGLSEYCDGLYTVCARFLRNV